MLKSMLQRSLRLAQITAYRIDHSKNFHPNSIITQRFSSDRIQGRARSLTLSDKLTGIREMTIVRAKIKLNSRLFFTQSYLSKKKKEKVKGKHKAAVVSVSEEELDGVINQQAMVEDMDDILEHLRQEYIQQLALRTNTDVFESLQIQTEDGRFPLNQLAQISMKSSQMMIINLSSTPQFITNVRDALQNSGLNINPQQEGTTLFVPIPKVTRERREELAKVAKTLCDVAKKKLRDTSNSYTKLARKAKSDHSEDLIKRIEKMIQQRMHDHGEKAENMLKTKQKELLS